MNAAIYCCCWLRIYYICSSIADYKQTDDSCDQIMMTEEEKLLEINN